MTELQKEFEATGYTSWINSDIYPDGKIYTKEYTEWLEKMVLVLRQPDVIKSVGNGANILRALDELRAEFTDEELIELQRQLPTVL